MSQKLLSICMPTYNRDQYIKKTLDNIISQALEFRGKVEICISDNCSTDTTKEIVIGLKEKYPDLIKYGKNEKNVGYDRNLLNVLGMADGKFSWTFGDYHFINEGGLKEVIHLLENISDENVGLVGVKQDVYILDDNNNKQVVQTNVDKTRPQIIQLNAMETIEESLSGFVNTILDTNSIKKIFKENYNLVEIGIGLVHMHVWLFNLTFILNPNMKCYILNKAIALTYDNRPKIIIEDQFFINCHGGIRFNGLLKSICRDRGQYDFTRIYDKHLKRAKLYFIFDMLMVKSVDKFEFYSFTGCIRSFYHCIRFIDASFFSISFLVISLTPGYFSRMIVKTYLKIRHGEKAESVWNHLSGEYFRNPRTKIGSKFKYKSIEWRGQGNNKDKF